MWEAVALGPHQSSQYTKALAHFAVECAEKVRVGQAKLIRWDDIKDNPPPQLKISPIVAIPHKSNALRSILDLSLSLHLKNGGILESVNDSTLKMAPQGALDQLQHQFQLNINSNSTSISTHHQFQLNINSNKTAIPTQQMI